MRKLAASNDSKGQMRGMEAMDKARRIGVRTY